MIRSAKAECPRCEATIKVVGDDIGTPCICGRCHTTLVVHPVPRITIPRGTTAWLVGISGSFLTLSLLAALIAYQGARPTPRASSPTGSSGNQPPSTNAPATATELVGSDPATRVFKATTGSVVAIEVETRSGVTGAGSGFVVHPDGWIVTNAHVVEDLARGRIDFEPGRPRQFSRVHAVDTLRDLAVIKVSATGLTPIPLAGDLPPIGERVFAIGTPRGQRNSLSDGLVSGIRDSDGVTYIQSTASISPGSSGGALVDINGQLIGVTTLAAKPSFANDMYFSVSVVDLRRFLQQHGVPLP